MKSKIFFTKIANGQDKTLIIKKLKDLLNYSEFDKIIKKNDYIPVKTHFGEKNSTTHIPPWFFKPIASRIKQKGGKCFLTETSTLYKGQRSDAVSHITHAIDHGFTIENTGMPIIMADGLKGDDETDVDITKECNKTVKISGLLKKINTIVCASHPTGHIGMGFGGAIKNLGMGLASRKGKMVQHSKVKPKIIEEKCTLCLNCIKWCPENAIEKREKSVHIMEKKCIGCGECLTECRFGAVTFNWDRDESDLQKFCAEHALGVTKNRNIFYINYLINFTKNCDCFGTSKTKIIEDFGLLAGYDPVAIDQATIDLIEEREQKPLSSFSYENIDPEIQIIHAEKIGLGFRGYELIKIN